MLSSDKCTECVVNQIADTKKPTTQFPAALPAPETLGESIWGSHMTVSSDATVVGARLASRHSQPE